MSRAKYYSVTSLQTRRTEAAKAAEKIDYREKEVAAFKGLLLAAERPEREHVKTAHNCIKHIEAVLEIERRGLQFLQDCIAADVAKIQKVAA